VSDEIERDVREGDVFLEDGRMTAPLGEPVPEHEAVVAEAKEILKNYGTGRRIKLCSHSTSVGYIFTPRGTL